jgi:hypothetical protein
MCGQIECFPKTVDFLDYRMLTRLPIAGLSAMVQRSARILEVEANAQEMGASWHNLGNCAT